MSAKMDGVYTRTPQQLEQKLDLGKRFAEIMGIATDARDTAEEAKDVAKTLDDNLTAEEIYNRLTNNGESQGLYRDKDGNLFVNGAYIYALEELFAKNVTITAEVFLEPEQEEIEKIQKHLLGTDIIPIYDFPLYDFNNDGNITLSDLGKAQRAYMGVESLSTWSGAIKSQVTLTLDMSNPDKFIRVQGTNMWGRTIDRYIGVNGTNIRNLDIADFVVESGTEGIWTYEKWHSGVAKCWAQKTANVCPGLDWANGHYYAAIPSIELPSIFNYIPVLNVSIEDADANFLITKRSATATETGLLYVVSLTKYETSTDVRISLEAKGKWK